MNEQCITIPSDDCEYKVHFDYQPAESPNMDIESRTCGPGCEAGVTINRIEILLKGAKKWLTLDAADLDFDHPHIEFLTQECLNDMERYD